MDLFFLCASIHLVFYVAAVDLFFLCASIHFVFYVAAAHFWHSAPAFRRIAAPMLRLAHTASLTLLRL